MENKELNAQAETTEQKEATPTVEDLQAQIAQLQAERDKLKQTVSASNSDASKRKKEAQEWQDKYKSTLDEKQRKELEAKEANEQLLARLTELETKERISTYKAKLMSAGFDEASAGLMATNLPDGIADTFFETQKAFLENVKQTVKTQTLNSQPGLPQGSTLSANDIEASKDRELRAIFGL